MADGGMHDRCRHSSVAGSYAVVWPDRRRRPGRDWLGARGRVGGLDFDGRGVYVIQRGRVVM